jgi:predicted ATP-grasp superfamily ATP-dependent carboligase
VLFVIGSEPQLRWRTFCRSIVGAVRRFEPRLVVTLGALLAEVPHTRAVPIVGIATDPAVVSDLGLQTSRYEGPTGIVGVLQRECYDQHLRSASLWAAVPTYVPSATSPKAALALVERCTELLGVALPTTDLEVATAAYERQINELVEADDETAAYVNGLESSADDDLDTDTDTDTDIGEGPGSFIEEVERFLREQGG